MADRVQIQLLRQMIDLLSIMDCADPSEVTRTVDEVVANLEELADEFKEETDYLEGTIQQGWGDVGTS